ncbi:mitochondrial outer membrane protein porin 1-like [Gastrolobium bilobum]|uniref:mitochondrial outer membrane protein porin 1-like n=1 Tax=Gastrolobium bilobum TaxID=150636 RepID=UPI002AB18854|nr:mitochondrial outer membrane protein porin 1-like [Gastrolobium bilobum]
MRTCPGLYFDIGKKARDVLHKDYAQQSPVHFHYQLMDWNLDLSCQVEEIVPGFRSLFNCTIPDSGKVELQYLNNYTGITGCIGLLGNPERGGYDPVANFSGLIGTSILSLGANVAFDISSRTISKLNAGLSFNSAFLIASLTLHDRFDTLKASCYHEVNPLTKTAIAAEVKHSLSMKETGVTIGAQHAFFPQTVVKARLDTSGKVGALIQQGFWQRFFVTMAGEMDFGTNELPKVGVSMALR